MALDIHKLRPSELTRLLNSSPLGAISDERQLYNLRMRAGFRIGEGKHINLLKFTAWLFDQRHNPKPIAAPKDYEAHKAAARERNAKLSASGRDIGDIPAVENIERKQAAEMNYQLFLESYFPHTFHLKWSSDHLTAIHKIEQAVLHGGLFALAMPRAAGKTSLSECAAIWASFYGHRKFTVLIGSDESAAVQMLDSIKSEIENNETLLADFPEVCFPIAKLEGIANRCSGQLYQSERTNISWTANEIILPNIPNSKAGGIIMRVAGITGRIRGMKYKHPSGVTLRPSLVIPDDPQTDESANSLSQCANRERIIAGAILGLAGPGKKIAGIMPCTVIRPGDLADRILDRDKHPEWNGERTRMMDTFPSNEKLWDTYAEIRADNLRSNGNIEKATAFYQKHQPAMDTDAVVSWAERFNHDEISAIQHAMNLFLTNEESFWSEYQNEPVADTLGEDRQLDVDNVCRKLNGIPRHCIPITANTLTCFIDIQGKLLYYVVVAWEDNFTGYVVDYGSYPDQRRQYFSLRDARNTLQRKHPKTGLEGCIYAGLDNLCNQLIKKKWIRDDGSPLHMSRILIDANWGSSTDSVYNFCRASEHAALLNPSHGRYVGASTRSFHEYQKKRGDKIGHNWRLPARAGKHALRHVIYDTNYWKTCTSEALLLGLGNPGTLSLYGMQAIDHQMFAEQCCSEYQVKTQGRGRTVNEWKIRPGIADNHLWDCVVGCAVAASMQGVAAVIQQPCLDTTQSKRRKLSEIQKMKLSSNKP
ncbi:MAG: phage terminase large subunit family protein [Planctomycetes bacterium]|nr:phage terminase large subunit family protein [Planctomycetota bacterium]